MYMVKQIPAAEKRNLWAVLPGKLPLLMNSDLKDLMY
jgi:hypothetical protein